ncbi:iron dicitrate transporter FecR [Bacteroidia bacterium]|nr:iron dicitrate transporter FecR [Bacteroidia bacterium]
MFINFEIIKHIGRILSKEEEILLQKWLAESEEHRKLYENIKNSSLYNLSEEQLNVWREEYINKLNRLGKRRRMIRRIQIFSGAAAAIAILLWTSSLFLAPPENNLTTDVKRNDRDILLTSSTGEIVEWDKIKSDTLYIDGVAVAKQAYALSYPSMKQEDEAADVALNRLYVPRGKEFQLELSDGTKVWLNSDTELQFSVLFSGKERRITLKGEAYFDVARDETTPFIVSIEGAEIKVLGTQFNVNTRNMEKQSATLITGSISITQEGQAEKILHPGETAEINRLTDEMKILYTDTRVYTAWRYKGYLFENESLENVLEELALWYDVEIVYEDEQMKQERFSGWLQRKDDVMSILRPIEKTNYVYFSIERNKIIVKRHINSD